MFYMNVEEKKQLQIISIGNNPSQTEYQEHCLIVPGFTDMYEYYAIEYVSGCC